MDNIGAQNLDKFKNTLAYGLQNEVKSSTIRKDPQPDSFNSSKFDFTIKSIEVKKAGFFGDTLYSYKKQDGVEKKYKDYEWNTALKTVYDDMEKKGLLNKGKISDKYVMELNVTDKDVKDRIISVTIVETDDNRLSVHVKDEKPEFDIFGKGHLYTVSVDGDIKKGQPVSRNMAMSFVGQDSSLLNKYFEKSDTMLIFKRPEFKNIREDVEGDLTNINSYSDDHKVRSAQIREEVKDWTYDKKEYPNKEDAIKASMKLQNEKIERAKLKLADNLDFIAKNDPDNFAKLLNDKDTGKSLVVFMSKNMKTDSIARQTYDNMGKTGGIADYPK